MIPQDQIINLSMNSGYMPSQTWGSENSQNCMTCIIIRWKRSECIANTNPSLKPATGQWNEWLGIRISKK